MSQFGLLFAVIPSDRFSYRTADGVEFALLSELFEATRVEAANGQVACGNEASSFQICAILSAIPPVHCNVLDCHKDPPIE